MGRSILLKLLGVAFAQLGKMGNTRRKNSVVSISVQPVDNAFTITRIYLY